MTTLYFTYHGGWTRSKYEAIQAARRGTKEDGGGVAEDVTAYDVPKLSLDVLLEALNGDPPNWPARTEAVVHCGKIRRDP